MKHIKEVLFSFLWQIAILFAGVILLFLYRGLTDKEEEIIYKYEDLADIWIDHAGFLHLPSDWKINQKITSILNNRGDKFVSFWSKRKIQKKMCRIEKIFY